MKENTTQLLTQDMESLRKHLDIDKWLLFGSSWGSTLSLAYGQAYPSQCLGFILHGIFLATQDNFEHLWYSMKDTYPEAWDEFNSFLPKNEQKDLINSYLKRVMNPDFKILVPAARAFLKYDLICSLALQSPSLKLVKNNDFVLNVTRAFNYCTR